MAENDTKHFSATQLQEGTPLYADGSDAYANNGFILSFFHIPSEKQVYFKAFITAYNETYSSDWSAETVYGRGDPIYMFKNTRRTITLAFKRRRAKHLRTYRKYKVCYSFFIPDIPRFNQPTLFLNRHWCG